MSTDSPITPAEDAADIAFETLAAEQRHFSHLYATPGVDPKALREQLHRSIAAEKRFRKLYDAISAPTPPDLRQEAARLGCEGTALFVLLAGFVSLFLPGLEENFWPLAVTFVATAAIGGWLVHFSGRLGQHIGRRM